MANNQGGAIIPYQPTYSIQYKYGDRYGGQNFAKPTTAINTGQAGGPLSAQATLDGEDATQTIVNPTTTASGGNGETLDSEASGAPGGTGGADFSQFRNQYTPAQPDYGWQYAHNYGNDPYTDPSLTGLFNTPTTPPPAVQGFYGSQQDGGESVDSNGDPSSMGIDSSYSDMLSITNGLNSNNSGVNANTLGAVQDINANNPGIGTETGTGAVGSGGDLGPQTDPGGTAGGGNPGNSGGGYGGSPETSGIGGHEGTSSDTSNDDTTSTAEDWNRGGLISPPKMGKRAQDIPNPILQDPFEHYFRRA